MVNNNDLRKFIVQTLLVYVAANNTLPDPEEVREDSYRGEVFSYPNIRVRVNTQRPDKGVRCNFSSADVTITVTSEEHSSVQVNDIAFAIASYFTDKTITDSSIANPTIKSVMFGLTELGGPTTESGALWTVQVNVRALVTSK